MRRRGCWTRPGGATVTETTARRTCGRWRRSSSCGGWGYPSRSSGPLGAGKADLTAVLDRRLAELGGEQASLERVRQVCGDLRRTGATYAALDPGRYLADLDAPALPDESGAALWKSAPSPALPQSDQLPTVCSAFRRFFARLFDEFLMILALIAGMCLAGSIQAW